MLELGTTSLTIVAVIAAIAVLALVAALVMRREVLAADDGTEGMRAIAGAVQEGAEAYLRRQMRTLVVFAAAVSALLFLLPGDGGIKVGRSIAFLVGAGFSAAIGYFGMWLAVRANVRVAAAARHAGGKVEGARIALRTGGVLSAILYSGRVIGTDEKQSILGWLRALPLEKYTVLVCDFANWADTAPLPCLVLKK